MVAVDHTPFSKDLIRRGWYLARGLKAPLLAVHVSSASQQPTLEEQASLKDNLELAEDLGAEIVSLTDGDAAAALARLAKERHITQIVLGRSHRSKWQQLVRPSMSRKLLGMVTQDIHIVSPQVPARGAQGTRVGGAE